MEENSVSFVEWKEEYVSQERGRRIVHYILKDSCGKSILAVVGTERSLRHMVYVVADDFLSYSGTDNPVQAGFKWRSRREVVDWLTSMLAKQHQAASPSGDSTHSLGSSELLSAKFFSADKMDRRVRNLKQSYSDIVWLGAAWTCGKQLKHYPAFCRNGTTIAVQSFVFVMAKEENRYVAYLEDMYEDKKGMKKVKVRWFHHSQEVKSVVRLRNSHPKEVYITPYTQVISVECVDGPAIVLTREHFEKYLEGFSDDLLGKLHLCCRQFRSNKIKPFDLRKLRGYHNQPLISCLESEIFPNSDSAIGNRVKLFGLGNSVAKGTKRKMNHTAMEGLQRKKFFATLSKSKNSDSWEKRLLSFKNGESLRLHIQLFKVDDNIELLCQDSGIRGCWFRCIVLEISGKKMKLQYKDLVDEDGDGNLEEWVPAYRLAAPDKLGIRFRGRPTIRPCPPVIDSMDNKLEVGAPVDAWWSDGWWEGVLTAVKGSKDDNVQVYVPGENKFLDVPRNVLRVSRDWLGGRWMDIKGNPNILASIKADTEQPIIPTPEKDADADAGADDSAMKTNLDENEEKIADLPAPVSPVNHHKLVLISENDDQNDDHLNKDKSHDVSLQDMYSGGNGNDNPEKDADAGADDCAIKTNLNENKEKIAGLPAPVSSVNHHKLALISGNDDQNDDVHNEDKSNDDSLQDMCSGGDGNDNPEQVFSSKKDYQNDDLHNEDKSNDVSLQDMCCGGDDNVNPEQVFSSDKDDQNDDLHNEEKSNDVSLCGGDGNGNPGQVLPSDKDSQNDDLDNKEKSNGDDNGNNDQNVGNDENGQKEGETGTKDTETAAQPDEGLEHTVVT